MAIGKSFEELKNALNYSFYDDTHLQNALTHSSYSNEYKSRGLNLPSNERLEFLGDAVLELVISEYLYENYSEYSEGRLTKMRQNLVCEKTLARIAEKISLGAYIHLGRGEEEECRTGQKVLADTMEAVFGAIYLDSKNSGTNDFSRVILQLYAPEFEHSENIALTDYKTALQQFIEKDGSAILEYEITDESGPEHKKEFTVVAKVNNNIVGTGKAMNKKDAQMEAAKMALKLFGLLG